jgi:hypothetical protein
VAKDAVISADATQLGNGGKVIVWGQDTARVHGTLSALGGANGGNGGLVETSGNYLDVAGARAHLRGQGHDRHLAARPVGHRHRQRPRGDLATAARSARPPAAPPRSALT